MEPTVQTTAVGQSVEKFHLSLWDLFMGADWVVQLIILMLFAASVWSWALIFSKVTSLRRVNTQAQKFEEAFWSGASLDHLYDAVIQRSLTPMTSLFVAVMKEWKRKHTTPNVSQKLSLQERLQRTMNVAINREVGALEKDMIFLASVGSTAPFVGLFGTVWGIMDSFQSIAASQSTNLAVVAPGIAEALFATAIGLIAAIPAVLAYNKLTTDINRFAARLDTFADEFLTLFSRQVEEVA
jgi:biopolymer transport protein TolQ